MRAHSLPAQPPPSRFFNTSSLLFLVGWFVYLFYWRFFLYYFLRKPFLCNIILIFVLMIISYCCYNVLFCIVVIIYCQYSRGLIITIIVLFFSEIIFFSSNNSKNAWEFGVLRAIGLSSSQVMRVYVYEAACLITYESICFDARQPLIFDFFCSFKRKQSEFTARHVDRHGASNDVDASI